MEVCLDMGYPLLCSNQTTLIQPDSDNILSSPVSCLNLKGGNDNGVSFPLSHVTMMWRLGRAFEHLLYFPASLTTLTTCSLIAMIEKFLPPP